MKGAQSQGCRIGIFGLGLIGSAIAARLMAAGYTICGYDPDAERRAGFVKSGGEACEPAQVWDTDVVFSCVFDTNQLAELIDAAPQSDAVLVSVSTCDPQRMQTLADLAATRGITLIEAPISGTSKALSQGAVTLFVAGDMATVTRLDPVLRQLSRQYLHVGAIGNGNRAKLAINLVLGLNRAALAEGMVFAKALGLDTDEFLKMVRISAAHSAVADSKGDLMARCDFAPQGRIVQSAKDFDLIRTSAAAVGQGLPFARTYLDMMQDAMEHGEGDLDNAAILLPIARTPAD
jgi:3-hydroxyisobutyrate dehydrogenase-like beta-hydroxyacid dehydrogenase